jgi:prophage regulatory protein
MSATARQHDVHDNVIAINTGYPPTHSGALRVLRVKDVTQKIGISRSTLYDWMNPKSPRYDATFPKHFKIGRHCIGWLEHQLDAWVIQKASRLAP